MTRIGLIQFAAADSPSRNLAVATEMIRSAVAAGAELVAMQELMTSVYFPLLPTDDEYFALAETLDGPTVSSMRDLALEVGRLLVVPFYERAAGHRFFNSAVVIGPDGSVIGHYRKHHIPRVHIERAGWAEVDEKYYFEPSSWGYPVFSTALGQLGLLICHDRHFPESARILALKGAEIIVIPSASRGIPGSANNVDVWLTELKAHAIANVAYVCGINRVGYESDEYFAGASVIVGPDGAVVAQGGDGPEIVLGDIDVSQVGRLRIARGFLRDRRPESYGELVL